MEVFSKLPLDSKIWVYAADRNLNEEERSLIQTRLDQFTSAWTAHDMPLQGAAAIMWNRLVVIALNESFQNVSGCGIDKSVQAIKDLGAELQINFFDRMQVLVYQQDALQTYNRQQLQDALNTGELSENTEVYNPLIQTLSDFKEKALIPLRNYWMAPQLKFPMHS